MRFEMRLDARADPIDQSPPPLVQLLEPLGDGRLSVRLELPKGERPASRS
jgi:hypothetical protein